MRLRLFFLMIVGMSNYLIGFQVGFHTNTNIGFKSTNEDRFVVRPNCLAVYDGSAGSYLSEFMKTKTEEILKQKNAWDKLKTICDDGQKYAEELAQKDFEEAYENYNKTLFLTTAAIAHINEQKKLNICWVGDTRIVVADRNANIIFETKDHKPDRSDEQARLIALQNELGLEEDEVPIYDCSKKIVRVRGEIAVSRAIGCLRWAKEKSVINEPEFYEKDLDETDAAFIINACDGLWDVISSQVAVCFVREKLNEKMPLNDICKALVDEALSRGSKDNVTVTILDLSSLKTIPLQTSIINRFVNRYSLCALGVILFSLIYYKLYR